MSLLRRTERRDTSSLTPERYIMEMTAQRTNAMPPVINESVALTHSAIWAGAYLYADLISTLPFQAMRTVDGESVPLRVQPQIIASPSVSVTPMGWRQSVVLSLILRGNAFGRILTRDQFGLPTTIELEHPDRVRGDWDAERLQKRFWVDNIEVDPYDIWHMGINLLPGSPFGLSMIGKARQAIYGGVAAATYSNEIFTSGGHPTAILSSEAPIDSDQAVQIQDRFDSRVAQRRGKPIVMQGLSYTPIQISPQDTQFIDAMKASVNDVARFLRLPVELLGGDGGNSMTYRNVESRAVDLLRYSIDPVLCRIEEAFTALLPQPQFVKANRAALLRMTTTDRYTAHHMALADGWRSINEVRALEDLPPVDGGDGFHATASPQGSPIADPTGAQGVGP